jgi:hypothetical protein
MRPLLLFCFVVIFLDGCIDPFDVPNVKNETLVVVDGVITDRPGPYQVNLSYANNISENLNFLNKVLQASIVLYDDQGNSEILREVVPGQYQTSENGIRGIVGHEYHIVITLLDGSVYNSSPEKLLPVGKLKKVYYEFEEKVKITPDSVPPGNGLNVYVDADVLPEQEGRVRWKTTGVYEVRTYPERRIIPVKVDLKGPVVWYPEPPACSGYVVSRNTVVQVRPCECCHCWIMQYDPKPLLSEAMLNKKEVTRQQVTFIPADPNVFFNKYYLKVEQMSLSQNIYGFWKQVRQQQQSSSDLFQTPPPKITGNINRVNGSARAVGYFGASSVRDTSFYITREALPYQLAPIDTIKDTCLLGARYGTTTKPPFWN